HLQVGLMMRNNQMNDGQFINQSFINYDGTISGDVHPFTSTPRALGKDDLGFGFSNGTNVGGQFANGANVATNFGNSLNVPGFGFINPLTSAAWNTPGSALRRAYDGGTRFSDSQSTVGWIWYQHWWTENLRSTLEASGIYTHINTGLLGQGTTVNKQLSTVHANLYWSPVAFIDFGVEGQWGHRQTVTNARGDAYALASTMRVRF